MTAKIVAMPQPVQITDKDLELAEDACRADAARCLREGSIEAANHWVRVAANMARARTPRGSNEG
jgi:hypothetical protein